MLLRAGASEGVHARERARDRIHRSGDGLVLRWLRLKLREGALHVGEGVLRGGLDLRAAGALDAVQGRHGLSDGLGQSDELRRDARIALKRA